MHAAGEVQDGSYGVSCRVWGAGAAALAATLETHLGRTDGAH